MTEALDNAEAALSAARVAQWNRVMPEPVTLMNALEALASEHRRLLVELDEAHANFQAQEARIREAHRGGRAEWMRNPSSYNQVAKERDEARAVSWSRADAEFVLDQLIDAGEIDQPSPNEYRAIIDRAMRSHYWRGRYWPSLSDCVGGDWDAIREAVREGIGA